MTVEQMLEVAVKHHQSGQLREAEDLYRQILREVPQHVGVLNLLGVIALQTGNYDLSIQYLSEALKINPNFADGHNHLGLVLKEQGRLAEALASHQRALTINPNLTSAYINLGNVLKQQGQLAAAIHYYQQALRIDPDSMEAHVNLGDALTEQGRPGEAAGHLQQAMRLNPNVPETHNNLGNALKDLGQLGEAAACYQQALRLRPHFPEAHLNLGMIALLMGNFLQGWTEYEWRRYCKGFANLPLQQPLWDGSPLAGRTILLHVEQGLGDAIQFIRFVPAVKKRGAGSVYLGCSPPLLRLLARCEGVDQVFPGTPMPPFHVHASLLSLPFLLGASSVESIAAPAPYVNVDADLVEKWRIRLQGVAGFRVGIVWQGRPDHLRDRWRSLPLRSFAPLAEAAGVSLLSLQKETGREQLEKMPGLALDLGPELKDLADTAAVLKNLDLLVAVDTSVVHLAGALGVPAWLALSYIPDWRWLLERDDSPWYPSLRLFRQRQALDWDDVMARIKAALGGALGRRDAASTLGGE